MNETKDATRNIVLLAPGLGEVRGRVALDLCVDGEQAARWLVVRPDRGPALVVQLEVTDERHPCFKATAWWLPSSCEPIEGRLGEATCRERVRALLGAGTGTSWLIFKESDELLPDPEEDWRRIAWKPGEVAALPVGFAEAVARRAEEWAAAFQVELDASGFTPLAVSLARGGDEHLGVEVIGWEAVRVVGAVRHGGQEALLIAEVRSVEDEPFEPLVEKGDFSLRLVPRTGADSAGRVAREQEPGLPLSPGNPP